MKILSRYVLREHLGPLAFALTALTSLLLLNFIAKRFGDLVGKGLPASVIAEFFALAIPFTVAMTLPMAVLVAVLYAFSRLAAEAEITALKASGVSMGRIMTPVLAGASVLAVAMVYFNDVILPAANHRLRILQTDIGRTKPTFALREQVVNELASGRLFLRARRIDKAQSRLHEVVIYDFGDGSKRRTIVADSGDLALVPGTGDLKLLLYKGSMTEIPNSSPTQMTRLFFQTNLIIARGIANSFTRDSADSYKSEREMGVCEMQKQVYTAEQDLYRERRAVAQTQRRAIRALTRGVVDTLRPVDSLKTASPGIGRFYCEASTLLAGLLSAGDSTARAPRGTVTSDSVTKPAPVTPPVTPNDVAATTVQAGVKTGTAVASPATPATVATTAAPPAVATPAAPQAATTGATPSTVATAAAPAAVAAGAAPATSATGDSAASGAAVVVAKPSDSLPSGPVPPSAPSAGVTITPEPQPNLAASQFTPSAASNGIGPIIEQAVQRSSIARATWAQYEVEIHKKFSLAVACVVFVLLGAPIALRFPRGGVGLVIGASLAVFSLYYICLIAGESMADDGVLPPWVAMWAANLVFTVVGLLLYARMGREGSTARGGDFDEVKDRIRGWIASLRPSVRRRAAVPVPAPDA